MCTVIISSPVSTRQGSTTSTISGDAALRINVMSQLSGTDSHLLAENRKSKLVGIIKIPRRK